MPFNMFPYSNLHNLNLDWILNTVKTMAAAVEAAATTVETYAARLSQVETNVQAITPAATGAVRHDVSQSLDAANRRRAATNIHAVSYDAVLLSADEQAQARSNIGAIGSGDIPPAANAVLYTEQSLTELQKAQARTNIEAVSSSQYNTLNGRVQSLEGSAVKYTSQSLTDGQKAQARTNIGAAAATDIPQAPVLYTAQQLTAAQKAQARSNIGAISNSALPDDYVFTVEENEQGTGYDVIGNLTDAAQATGRVFIILERDGQTREALADMSYTGATLNAVSASFADFFTVDSVIPNTITQVVITANSATVTAIQQRQVPQPSPLGNDAGKCLVAGRGACSWEQITPVVNTISGTTPTITPADNNIYNCGELTSLTISNPPATGAYSIVFTSGATATTTTIPATILGLEDFAAEANTLYEINVLDNRAVVGSWAVSSGE